MSAIAIDLHNIAAEHSVLGSLMNAPDSYNAVCDLLSAEHFYEHANRKIFAAIELLANRNLPFDVISVMGELDERNELASVGGLAYLGSIAANVPATGNVRRYAETVRDKACERALLAAAHDVGETLQRPLSTVDKLDAAQAAFGRVAESYTAKHNASIDGYELASAVLNSVTQRYESQGELCGEATGFADIDARTSGLDAGALVIVAGRPAMGKTTFALNVAEHVAQTRPVLVASLEMPAIQLGLKTLSSLSGIDFGRLRGGNLLAEDFDRMSVAIGKQAALKLRVLEAANTVGKLAMEARKYKRQQGDLGLIVVDYLQLMSSPGAENRTNEIGEISRGLKRLAREMHCPVIALSQLSRAVESRADKRPMMSDLRESGSIEQDADVILFMYRDEYYNPGSPYKGLAEAIISKQRLGETGVVQLVWQGEYSRFRDFDGRHIERAEPAKAAKRKGFEL